VDNDIKNRLVFLVTLSVTLTLCAVVMTMVGTLMVGLFSKDVDNKEIFELIGPAFQTIIGGFIGLLAGIKLNNEHKTTVEEKVIEHLINELKEKK